MFKKLLACIAMLSMCMPGQVKAKVTVTNRTDLPIKVAVHFIGIGSPTVYEINPSETQTKIKDLANIKRGYEVWIKENSTYKKVISLHKISDAGAFRKLDVLQHKDPETGEFLYSIYRSGY